MDCRSLRHPRLAIGDGGTAGCRVPTCLFLRWHVATFLRRRLYASLHATGSSKARCRIWNGSAGSSSPIAMDQLWRLKSPMLYSTKQCVTSTWKVHLQIALIPKEVPCSIARGRQTASQRNLRVVLSTFQHAFDIPGSAAWAYRTAGIARKV